MKSFRERLKTDKKTQALVGLSVLTLVFILVIVILFVQDGRPEIEDASKEDGSVVGSYRKLDGLLVEDKKLNGYPVAVMIENLASVRPQSGLTRAGVVYEALAEGGITRFMALYSGDDVEKIGPVRSARSYFVDIASEYNLLYAHAGGSPDALQKIGAASVVDLNQIGGDQAYFWRDDVLSAPHNLFTKSEFLTFALRDKDLLHEGAAYEAWSFVDETPTSKRSESGQKITIPFSSKKYEVQYEYFSDYNVYARSNGGVAHVDELTGEQIEPKNVIVQYVEQSVFDAEGRLSISVVGEGSALIFSGGKSIEGSWKKENEEGRTQFFDNESNIISLTRGQTWIELVPKENEVIY